MAFHWHNRYRYLTIHVQNGIFCNEKFHVAHRILYNILIFWILISYLVQNILMTDSVSLNKLALLVKMPHNAMRCLHNNIIRWQFLFVGNSLAVMPGSRLVSTLIDYDGKVSSWLENCTLSTLTNSCTVCTQDYLYLRNLSTFLLIFFNQRRLEILWENKLNMVDIVCYSILFNLVAINLDKKKCMNVVFYLLEKYSYCFLKRNCWREVKSCHLDKDPQHF